MPELQTPGTHFVEFADGTYAEYVRKRIQFAEDGVKKWRLWMRPGEDIIRLFGLVTGEDIDPPTGLVVKDYLFEDVHICREDPSFGRIWIMTDYNGDPTSLSQKNDYLKETIKNLQKQISSLKAGIANIQEEFRMALTNKQEWVKMTADIFLEAARVRRRNMSELDEEDSGGEA